MIWELREFGATGGDAAILGCLHGTVSMQVR
jgi:hypothetical protein